MKIHLQIDDATPAEMAEVLRILFTSSGAPLITPTLAPGPINLHAPAFTQFQVRPGLNLSTGSTGGTTAEEVAGPARQASLATPSSPQAGPTAAAATPPPAEAGPGPDDSDAVFFRCNTFTAVVKVLVGRGLKTQEDVLHGVTKLRGQGISVVDSVPEEKLADRVASSLIAAGVA